MMEALKILIFDLFLAFSFDLDTFLNLLGFAIIIFCFVLSYRFLKKKWNCFLSSSVVVKKNWDRTRNIVFIGFSIFFVVMGVKRWIPFHDEIRHLKHSKQLNLAYADQIEVETYLMSEQNVIELFEGKPPSPDRRDIPNESSLAHGILLSPDPRFYSVIRVRNKGALVAFGKLFCLMNGKIFRSVDVPALPPRMEEFKIFVFESKYFERNIPGEYPTLSTSWKVIITKDNEG